jgi:very-short-patch-repair endonuclease
LITRAQAISAGASRRTIDRLLSDQEWRRVLPQVYLVSQARLNWKAKLMAAILWAGPDAVVSHRSAAALLGLRYGDKELVEITTSRRLRSRQGITVHHDPAIAEGRKAFVDGIPCTTIPRTILDLCGVLSEKASEIATVEAVRGKKVSVLSLGRVLDEEARPGKGGTRALRRIVTKLFALGVTDSEAEDLFKAVAKRRGYDFTFHHVVQDPFIFEELDFASLPELVDIEIDGGEAHDDPAAVQRDKNRDAELESRGWAVLRFTYWDLINRPDWVFEKIAMTLENSRLRLAL